MTRYKDSFTVLLRETYCILKYDLIELHAWSSEHVKETSEHFCMVLFAGLLSACTGHLHADSLGVRLFSTTCQDGSQVRACHSMLLRQSSSFKFVKFEPLAVVPLRTVPFVNNWKSSVCVPPYRVTPFLSAIEASLVSPILLVSSVCLAYMIQGIKGDITALPWSVYCTAAWWNSSLFSAWSFNGISITWCISYCSYKNCAHNLGIGIVHTLI
jgi:hypothetical protein